MRWVVKDVVPDRVIVLQLLVESTQPTMAIRRDSLLAAGDSTIIVSTLVSPMIDSVRATGSDGKSKSSGGLLGLGSDLLLSMLRMQSKLDLMRLKSRIEGTAAAPRP